MSPAQQQQSLHEQSFNQSVNLQDQTLNLQTESGVFSVVGDFGDEVSTQLEVSGICGAHKDKEVIITYYKSPISISFDCKLQKSKGAFKHNLAGVINHIKWRVLQVFFDVPVCSLSEVKLYVGNQIVAYSMMKFRGVY